MRWVFLVVTLSIVYLAAALREVMLTLETLNDTNEYRRKAILSLDERLRRVEERRP